MKRFKIKKEGSKFGKKIVLSSVFLLFVVILTRLVLANFVCGQVENSEDNMSAAWYNIRIFYENNPEEYTTCDVSPAENKYCCDCEAIPGKSCKIGNLVFAEIFDLENGYVAEPVSISITGEGYDIFPKMKLEKVIKINSPSKKLIFSDIGGFLLNASFKQPYNFVELENKNEKIVLCNNCSQINQDIETEFGMNSFKLFASFEDKIFSEGFEIAILNDFNFQRKIECEKCKNNRVKRNQVVGMDLILDLSHYVEGLKLKEYIPVDWEIINTNGGEVRIYSETHNMIVWNVSGKEIIKNYVIRAPDAKIIAKEYNFKTELEEEVLNEEKIKVYGYFNFIGTTKKSAESYFDETSKNYFKIFPSKPLVIRPEDQSIIRLAVFPSQSIKNAEFDLMSIEDFNEEIDNNDLEIIDYYIFDTNINKYVDKIFIEFKVNKTLIENYENISLYVLDEDGNWVKADIEVYGEDESYVYYNAWINSNEILIVGLNKEEGILEKIMDFFN